MSIVQNLCFGDQYTRTDAQATNTQLCINKQWIESTSNQWPQWTESHLIFLIKRFGLCSISQDKITHLSIDYILQATTIYIDKAGWDNRHDALLWEKINLKIGYLHAWLTGQQDRKVVDQHSNIRLCIHVMQKKDLSSRSLTRNSNPLSPPFHPRPIPAPTPTFKPAMHTGRIASQYRPDAKIQPVGQALELWTSMSYNEQANLFQSQLQTAKNFSTLVMIVDRRCKYIQSSRARQGGNVSPTKAGHHFNTNTTNSNTNTLRLQTNLPASAPSYQRAPEPASSSGRSKSPEIVFDGLPSPTQTPEDGWSATPFSEGSSEKDIGSPHDIDDVQEINENAFAENAGTPEANQPPLIPKPLDVKSIIDNCIRELELKRKREKEAAEGEKREREEEEEEDMKETVGLEEFEERRKRCRIQVII